MLGAAQMSFSTSAKPRSGTWTRVSLMGIGLSDARLWIGKRIFCTRMACTISVAKIELASFVRFRVWDLFDWFAWLSKPNINFSPHLFISYAGVVYLCDSTK
jgi:hypothetical protein